MLSKRGSLGYVYLWIKLVIVLLILVENRILGGLWGVVDENVDKNRKWRWNYRGDNKDIGH